MLYTGKGDKGDTGLFGKRERVSKASDITEALGALDECNAYLGLCRAEAKDFKNDINIIEILHTIQRDLFIIQAHVAGAPKNMQKEKVTELENITNTVEEKLPKIESFSVSGNSLLSAKLDVARTLVRKAERRVVLLDDSEDINIQEEVLAYLNRLSSVLFALTRYTEHLEGAERESPTYM